MAPSQPSRRHHPKCAPKQKASQKHVPSTDVPWRHRFLHWPGLTVVVVARVVVTGCCVETVTGVCVVVIPRHSRSKSLQQSPVHWNREGGGEG